MKSEVRAFAQTHRSHDGVDPNAALLDARRDEVKLCFGRRQHKGSRRRSHGNVVELNAGNCGERNVAVHIDAAPSVVAPNEDVVEEPNVQTSPTAPDGSIRYDQATVVEQRSRRNQRGAKLAGEAFVKSRDGFEDRKRRDEAEKKDEQTKKDNILERKKEEKRRSTYLCAQPTECGRGRWVMREERE